MRLAKMMNYSSHKNTGRVIWITGLSGAGKSTLAAEVAKYLREKNDSVILLDGDELRSIFDADGLGDQNYSRDKRLALSLRYARLCKVISDQGVIVVISTVSMFKEVYNWNRKNFIRYFEVYLKVPMEELRRRDSKNIYHRFDNGEIMNVAGLDVAIDEPTTPDWAPRFKYNRCVGSLRKELLETLGE